LYFTFLPITPEQIIISVENAFKGTKSLAQHLVAAKKIKPFVRIETPCILSHFSLSILIRLEREKIFYEPNISVFHTWTCTKCTNKPDVAGLVLGHPRQCQRAWVDFINVQSTAFTLVDPESTKKYS